MVCINVVREVVHTTELFPRVAQFTSYGYSRESPYSIIRFIEYSYSRNFICLKLCLSYSLFRRLPISTLIKILIAVMKSIVKFKIMAKLNIYMYVYIKLEQNKELWGRLHDMSKCLKSNQENLNLKRWTFVKTKQMVGSIDSVNNNCVKIYT